VEEERAFKMRLERKVMQMRENRLNQLIGKEVTRKFKSAIAACYSELKPTMNHHLNDSVEEDY
jgi:hypothetical protein